MRKFRTVIIGMGRMGKTRYVAMKKHGHFEITGLCDNDISQLGEYDINKYEDWKCSIDQERPEIVVVCTVNAVIPQVVCYALEKGCHVFAEKPPGKTLEDALTMKKAFLKHKNQILKFGFNHRYHYSVIEAKSLIDSGFLGKVVNIRGVYGKAGNLQKSEWRNDIEIAGGGILLDQGIHMLDLLRYFVGDFKFVKGFTEKLVWKEAAGEDTAFITLKTDSGKVATLHSSAIQWKHKFDMDITCTNGYIALNGLLTSTKSYGEERITYYRKDLEQKSGKLGNPTEYTMCFDEDSSWDFEIEEFYKAIKGEKPIMNGTIEDAVAVMELIDKVYGNKL
ncbi:gfo/Idh/MocA family oxidoreductase [Schaedlerella arabinosiphila]|uniref:Gfo/Idh/MocA family oxidoreductase n=1 Tax=Schaedlerella arabinosiphila TaxID=2044587 RepID=A0A3R8L2N3_9FIRM|nr:Gfo/Idh/MocA family oxidoreductase [Schaedlerella arabinosiphila]RRK33733.1 gfo/Idh/MocA family oxidoreductase [Schaedlerella arabinosiphila]